jgi:hypothetical protein
MLIGLQVRYPIKRVLYRMEFEPVLGTLADAYWHASAVILGAGL